MKNNSAQVTSVKLYSVEEVKNCLSISRPTVVRMINSGILRTIRLGRAVRIPEGELIDLIQRGGQRNIQQEN